MQSGICFPNLMLSNDTWSCVVLNEGNSLINIIPAKSLVPSPRWFVINHHHKWGTYRICVIGNRESLATELPKVTRQGHKPSSRIGMLLWYGRLRDVSWHLQKSCLNRGRKLQVGKLLSLRGTMVINDERGKSRKEQWYTKASNTVVLMSGRKDPGNSGYKEQFQKERGGLKGQGQVWWIKAQAVLIQIMFLFLVLQPRESCLIPFTFLLFPLSVFPFLSSSASFLSHSFFSSISISFIYQTIF